MRPSLWSNGFSVRSDDSGAEFEALQTDVMRFLSILALCLMAVFSMVQNKPVESRDDRPIVNPIQITESESGDERSAAQKPESTVSEDKVGEKNLEAVRPIAERTELREDQVKQPEDIAEMKKETESKKAGKSGAPLRFESTDALYKSVRNDSVELYAEISGIWWRYVREHGQNPRFQYIGKVRNPALVVNAEITGSVPREITDLLMNKISVYRSDRIRWWAALPEKTVSDIKRMTQQAYIGLVIHSDGTVTASGR